MSNKKVTTNSDRTSIGSFEWSLTSVPVFSYENRAHPSSPRPSIPLRSVNSDKIQLIMEILDMMFVLLPTLW